jgi:hypothetical protein
MPVPVALKIRNCGNAHKVKGPMNKQELALAQRDIESLRVSAKKLGIVGFTKMNRNQLARSIYCRRVYNRKRRLFQAAALASVAGGAYLTGRGIGYAINKVRGN